MYQIKMTGNLTAWLREPFNSLGESTEGRHLAETIREAYILGFKRGFRAAKMEDMPWWFRTEQEEKEWLHRNNINVSRS